MSNPKPHNVIDFVVSEPPRQPQPVLLMPACDGDVDTLLTTLLEIARTILRDYPDVVESVRKAA